MIVCDCEMSGTDPILHSLVSIGAVDFLEPSRQFYAECRIWDGARIMDEGLAVNGFSKQQISDPTKKPDWEITKEFFDWALAGKNHTIGGQNVSCDIEFLRESARRAHINFPLAFRLFDLHSMCYLHMVERGVVPPVEKGRSDLGSDEIMAYVGIPTEPHPHNALNGALYEAEAFSRLLHHKNLLPQFAQYPIAWKKS